MKQIVITNVPDDQHAALKSGAQENFRTLGQHVLALAFQAAGISRSGKPTTPRKKKAKA